MPRPEAGTFTLTAGSWHILGEDFAGDAGTSDMTITVAHPEAEE